MSALDLSRLGPADALAALRSYPRRFRAALVPIADDEDVEELAHRVGPDGSSAIEVVDGTGRTWSLQCEALRQIALADNPVVHAAVLDRSQRHWQTPPPESVELVLDVLTENAQALVEAVERIEGRGWSRTASVAGGGPVGGLVSALDVVKDAVAVGHDDLAEVERILSTVRDAGRQDR